MPGALKKHDNTALARFITLLGSLNSYGSTVLQTKQSLDSGSTKPLRQNADDIAIYQFTDSRPLKKPGKPGFFAKPLSFHTVQSPKIHTLCD
jgi:hypothetical protein